MNIKSVFYSLLIFITLVSCMPKGGGIQVELNNSQSFPITNIELTFTGGSKTLTSLQAGEKQVFLIKPDSESGLTLTFLDNEGNDISKKIDTYIEKGLSGKIIISVIENNEIKVDSDIKI